VTGFAPALLRLVDGERLSQDEMRAAFAELLAGEVEELRAAAFLTALRVRGETPGEVAGAAEAMRAAALRIASPEGTLDTCGTGGSGQDALNVSTATAIVLAGLGVPVAKHGNRAVSSLTGSSDVLSALGVNLDIPPERAETILAETGLVFLFAPNHHPGMKHVAPVRKGLGFRTLFNLLGPLSNPAGAKRQVLGVYDKALLRPVAEALRATGSERAFVVHGSDGLDELTVTGESFVCALEGGGITEFAVTPEEAGLQRREAGSLRGGGPEENAAAMLRLLRGEPGAFRDAVLLNAAAGLIVSGRASSLKEGAAQAAGGLDDGRALAALERLKGATA